MSRDYMTILDGQMSPHTARLHSELKIESQDADWLATTIYDEVRRAEDLHQKLIDTSPVSIRVRLLVFENFFVWNAMKRAVSECPSGLPFPAEIVQRSNIQMHWAYYLYIHFVFPGDNLFNVLAKNTPADSCVRKCSRWIRENPVRALRNAIAHGNWQLPVEGPFLEFWAKEDGPSSVKGTFVGNGTERANPVERQEMNYYGLDYEDLEFTLAVARCTAWPALRAVDDALLADLDDGVQST